MGRVGWLSGVCAIAAVTVLLAPVPLPLGAEEVLTRDEYVKRLEGMCKPRAEATQTAMKGVRKDVRYPKRLPIAVGKFAKGAEIFGGTIEKIAEVPRPAADVGRLEGMVQLPEPAGASTCTKSPTSCAWATRSRPSG